MILIQSVCGVFYEDISPTWRSIAILGIISASSSSSSDLHIDRRPERRWEIRQRKYLKADHAQVGCCSLGYNTILYVRKGRKSETICKVTILCALLRVAYLRTERTVHLSTIFVAWKDARPWVCGVRLCLWSHREYLFSFLKHMLISINMLDLFVGQCWFRAIAPELYPLNCVCLGQYVLTRARRKNGPRIAPNGYTYRLHIGLQSVVVVVDRASEYVGDFFHSTCSHLKPWWWWWCFSVVCELNCGKPVSAIHSARTPFSETRQPHWKSSQYHLHHSMADLLNQNKSAINWNTNIYATPWLGRIRYVSCVGIPCSGTVDIRAADLIAIAGKDREWGISEAESGHVGRCSRDSLQSYL